MRLSNIEEASDEIGEELPEEGKKTELKIDLEAKENESGLSMIMPKSEPEDKKEDEEDSSQRKSMVIN